MLNILSLKLFTFTISRKEKMKKNGYTATEGEFDARIKREGSRRGRKRGRKIESESNFIPRGAAQYLKPCSLYW